IASVTTNQFYDTGLNNGTEFCYLIKSIGKYSSSGLINPIINWSQIACASPIDLEPPCTPNVTISPDCDLIKNIITWDLPYDTCLSDILKYEIYYTPIENGELTLIYTTNNLNDNTYIHDTLSSIAGCYSVIAIDSFGNHSSFNNITCIDIDNCSLYNLPNVFTPDGDGINDYFKPFPYNFVEKIDITIFNRWGEIVFETTNPDVNWDGKNQYTKKDCSDGVYYYICDIYEKRLKGIVKRTTQGVIHLLRK
ncbi:MAG TPA: gliding motility-associated C-terminal domain-containing protein, partial [Bacteroidales bacterium]|nr:gliding motility-associated C-terminal domain-containing protein [Bacteroidales bacterium]